MLRQKQIYQTHQYYDPGVKDFFHLIFRLGFYQGCPFNKTGAEGSNLCITISYYS